MEEPPDGKRHSQLQVGPLNLIYSEILAVTTIMRKNQRFSTTSYSAKTYTRVQSRHYGVTALKSKRDGEEEEDGFSVTTTGMREKGYLDGGNRGEQRNNDATSLMSGFMQLKMRLREIQDVSELDPVELLQPFLDVIQSPSTSGPITSTALTSIDKFLNYSILSSTTSRGSSTNNHHRLSLAIQMLSSASTHCKFEASDSTSDEVVLLKILDVLRNLLQQEKREGGGKGGVRDLLSDESVCEMMETGLSMCCQMRLSEMLRRSAERTMQSMVASCFSRLTTLDPSISNSNSTTTLNTEQQPPQQQQPPTITTTTEEQPSSSSNNLTTTTSSSIKVNEEDEKVGYMNDGNASSKRIGGIEGEGEGEKVQSFVNHQDPNHLDVEVSEEEEEDLIIPFGLPSIQELLRVLISLLNPHDQQHTDSMRLMALGLLNIAIEVGGTSMGEFEDLRVMVGDPLCKHLFQLARSDNPQILSTSLRVITNLFDTMKPYLKLQQELFFSFLLDRLIFLPSTFGGGNKRGGELELELDRNTWLRDELREEQRNLNSSSVSRDRGSNASSGERSHSTGPQQGGGGGNQNGVGGGDKGPSLETRELMLEILTHFATRGRYSLVDLWVNYDCNVEGEDLFERLSKFLSRGVYPSNNFSTSSSYPHHQQHRREEEDSFQFLCLEALLELVDHMASRIDEPSDPNLPKTLAEDVAKSKSNKQILLEAAQAFNLKPKVGIKFLEEHGIIPTSTSSSIGNESSSEKKEEENKEKEEKERERSERLANFLKTTPKLDKKLLGDFISRPDQIETLRAFMRSMDFSGKIICDAMRELLEAFRLPGESQQINRITETFAEVYFATNPPEIKSQDATYVLAYSVIMLNTDAHNPQVRKRMDLNAYSRNLRGVNENSDFAPEYLSAIYDSIRKREIILPEEHQNQVGFEYGWKELLRRSRRAGLYTHSQTNVFDRGMFAVCWKPLVSALSYAFSNFSDDYMVQRAIGGLNHCAALASRFEMSEVFDFLILSLARVTGLTSSPTVSTSNDSVGNFPVVDVEGHKLTVSPLAVRFGMNVKAQLAAVVLFTIANNNGAFIREGWTSIFEILQTLFVHSLLPPSMTMMEDFLSGESAIPLKPKSTPRPREDRRGDGGLLSTLSSYLLSPYGSNGDVGGGGNEFTDDDIETTLSAVDTVASCRVEELYSQIFDLKGSALTAPLQSLIDLEQRLTVDRLRTRSGSGSLPNSPQISITASRDQLPYDPCAVLLLEIVTSVVSRSQDALSELWPTVYDFLSRMLASANSFSSLFNERVVASLLRLLTEVIKVDELRDSTFLALDTLRSLSPAVLTTVAEPLMSGLSKLFIENTDRIKSPTEWNLVFALFSVTAHQEAAAKISMDLLRQLAAGQLGAGLQAENYGSFLQVLGSFASAAPSSSNSKPQPERTSDEATLQRGIQIVDILRDVQLSIPRLISSSTLSPARAWESAWIPLLSAYAQLCLTPARELRQNAISSLQRTLLAPEILVNTEVDLTIIFTRVFFPLLEELLKPTIFRRDPEGMGETRLRASALLCKIFLQYLAQLQERKGMKNMTELWLKILGYQDRFMHSGRRDQMFEAVPELLKNVLLVMNASGFLVPPHDTNRTTEQAALWNATFERIHPFLPDLQRELFPPPQVPVPFSSSSQPQLAPQPSESVPSTTTEQSSQDSEVVMDRRTMI